MNPEEVHELVQMDIASWLRMLPDDADIEAYAASLDEQYYPDLTETAQRLLLEQIEHMQQFAKATFGEGNASAVDAIDLHSFIQNLARYSPQSVVANFQKTHPTLQPRVPVEVTEWAQTFLKKVHVGVAANTAPQYIRAKVYMNSLVASVSADAHAELYEDLCEHHLRDAELVETGREYTQADKDQWVAFYKSLTFLPEQECDRLARMEAYLERFDLNRMLITILSVLRDVPDAAQRSTVLWQVMQREWLEKYLSRAEGERSVQSSLTALYDALYGIWREATVRDNTAVAQTQQVLAQSAQVSRQELDAFFEDNIALQAVVEPLALDVIVANLAECETMGEAEAYILTLANNPTIDPSRLQLIQSCVRQIATVLISHAVRS